MGVAVLPCSSVTGMICVPNQRTILKLFVTKVALCVVIANQLKTVLLCDRAILMCITIGKGHECKQTLFHVFVIMGITKTVVIGLTYISVNKYCARCLLLWL